MRALKEQYNLQDLFPLTQLKSNDISNILRACLNNQLDSILGTSPFYIHALINHQRQNIHRQAFFNFAVD